MKITARDIDRFLATPPKNLALALFYGRDMGLISERAATLAKNSGGDVDDPFATTNITGETIAQDPAVLYDSAAAIAATGGKRLVRVTDVSDAALTAVTNVLDHPPAESITIMTASELNTRSAVVKKVEGDSRAAAIGCYPDQAQDLARMARAIFAKDAIRVDSDAMLWITSHLGGDHLLSRSELEKLAIMAGKNGHITLAMAQDGLGDSAAISGYAVATAAASGDLKTLTRCFDRAMADAIPPEAILRIAMAHFGRLFRLAVMMGDQNMSAAEAVKNYKPPIFFSEQRATIHAMGTWHAKKSMQAVERLLLAERQSRQGIDASTATAHALIALCHMGHRGRRP